MEEELVADRPGRSGSRRAGGSSGRTRAVTVGLRERARTGACSSRPNRADGRLGAEPRGRPRLSRGRWATRAFDAVAEPLDTDDHVRAIRALILRYGTPSEDLGRGPSFRLRPVVRDDLMAIDARDLEVRIGRPPADVFALLTDVERWPEWLIASGHRPRRAARRRGPLVVGIRLRDRPARRRPRRHAPGHGHGASSRRPASPCAARTPTASASRSMPRLVPDGPGTRADAGACGSGCRSDSGCFESMAKPQVRRAAALDLEAFRQRLESVADG